MPFSLFKDPSTWITETYPWPPSNHAGPQALLSLRPEDVGYDALAPTVAPAAQDKFKSDNQGENDPLVSCFDLVLSCQYEILYYRFFSQLHFTMTTTLLSLFFFSVEYADETTRSCQLL